MINFKRLLTQALSIGLIGMIATPLFAQLPTHLRDYPLASRKTNGDLIAPFFDGWIRNEDRSVTMIFGFMNRNTKEIVDIPLGPNNYIEPAQFDGVQPTHFPVYERGGFRGIRERGAFAVTVPADMAGTEVVWTLKHGGHSYSIPGRAKSPAYQMSNEPLALGSLNPAIRFDMDGDESTDREGIYGPKITGSVGKPINLTAYVQDRGEREGYEVESLLFPVGTEWVFHQGPAQPDFSNPAISGKERAQGDDGEMGNGWSAVQTDATFWEPGEYVIRLRVDNFSAPDSGFDYQCCWSNAYLPVTITP